MFFSFISLGDWWEVYLKGASLTDLSAEVKILYAIRLRDQSVISRKAGVKLSSLESAVHS